LAITSYTLPAMTIDSITSNKGVEAEVVLEALMP